MANIAMAPRERFPAVTAPIPTRPSKGRNTQKPKALRECAVVTGPNVLIVNVVLVAVPGTGKLGCPCGYVKVHTGAIVTSGLIDAHASVTPAFGSFGLLK